MVDYFDTRYAPYDRLPRIPTEGNMGRRSGAVVNKLVLQCGLVLRGRLGAQCRQEERTLGLRNWHPVRASKELPYELGLRS